MSLCVKSGWIGKMSVDKPQFLRFFVHKLHEFSHGSAYAYRGGIGRVVSGGEENTVKKGTSGDYIPLT